jgi:hypothetical protein
MSRFIPTFIEQQTCANTRNDHTQNNLSSQTLGEESWFIINQLKFLYGGGNIKRQCENRNKRQDIE